MAKEGSQFPSMQSEPPPIIAPPASNPHSYQIAASPSPQMTPLVDMDRPQLPFVTPGELCIYGDCPLSIVCQYCHATIVTATYYRNGALTYTFCCGLLCFGLWCGCCIIPFYMDSTKDIEHRCPNCDSIVGRKARIC